MITTKINRFVDNFDKKNNDRELAIFLSEVIEEIEKEQLYTSQIEMDLFERESEKNKFINFIADTQKIIYYAKLMLNIYRYAYKKAENSRSK